MKYTRSGPRSPSALAKDIETFALRRKRDIIVFNSKWFERNGDKIYVRNWRKDRLELASWAFRTKGRGHATMILDYLESLVLGNHIPQTSLFVENVINQKFADFFRKRNGWSETVGPSFVFSS